MDYVILNVDTNNLFSGYRYYNNRMNQQWDNRLVVHYPTIEEAKVAQQELKLQGTVTQIHGMELKLDPIE